MRLFSLIAVVLFVSSLTAPARAGMVEDCEQDRNLDRLINGCSAMIRSGEFSSKTLAIAYDKRGIAYTKLGEYRRAIEDYDQALRLDPGYAIAYNNRGDVYNELDDYERAAKDWEQSIRIDGAPRAKHWQEYMKGKGHYLGAIDGVFGPGTRRALVACARDPDC